MPHRVIIHAGFHKTGTSTVQTTLRENRVALKKHIALRLRWHMKDIVAAARGYAHDHDPLTLIKLQTRFGKMMNDLPGMPRRTLVISAEELTGHLPGRGQTLDYSAAPVLLYAYWEIAQARFPRAEILIYLSTRATKPWLASAHWEHVRSSDMTLELPEFCDRYQKVADLTATVAEITDRLPTPVHSTALEDCADLPLGPTDPLLDLCDIPAALRATLVPVPKTNQRPGPEVLAAMLEVNRTVQDTEQRKAAKEAILAEAWAT